MSFHHCLSVRLHSFSSVCLKPVAWHLFSISLLSVLCLASILDLFTSPGEKRAEQRDYPLLYEIVFSSPKVGIVQHCAAQKCAVEEHNSTLLCSSLCSADVLRLLSFGDGDPGQESTL